MSLIMKYYYLEKQKKYIKFVCILTANKQNYKVPCFNDEQFVISKLLYIYNYHVCFVQICCYRKYIFIKLLRIYAWKYKITEMRMKQ